MRVYRCPLLNAKISGPSLRALYDNLEADEDLALRVDESVRNTKKESWRGNYFKEKEVRIAIKAVLGQDQEVIEAVFEIVKSQNEY